MNAAPSFTLPACPLCSNIVRVDRPYWKLARHTTQKTGRPTYSAMGCKHAVAVLGEKFRDKPEDWAAGEDAWKHACDLMFEEKMEGRSALARHDFARMLDGRSSLPGVTENLPLTDSPSQEDNEKPNP